jgi:hypothetical protein
MTLRPITDSYLSPLHESELLVKFNHTPSESLVCDGWCQRRHSWLIPELTAFPSKHRVHLSSGQPLIVAW